MIYFDLRFFYSLGFNKILEDKLYKVIRANKTKTWLKYLDQCVKSYNETEQRGLYGLSPNAAHQKSNEMFLRAKFIEERKRHKTKFKRKPAFAVGENVRIVKTRSKFERSYDEKWESEIRSIDRVLPTSPYTYFVSGKMRAYYEPELVKVGKSIKEGRIRYEAIKSRITNEKISRSGKTYGGQREILLKDISDNSSVWVNLNEFKDLIKNGYVSTPPLGSLF